MKKLTETQTRLIMKWIRSLNLSVCTHANKLTDHFYSDVEDLLNEGSIIEKVFESLQSDMLIIE